MNTKSKTYCRENGLIDISGLCDPKNTTEVLGKHPYWKQMYLSESLEIPPQKPDAEQINSVIASVHILKKQVIVTPSTTVPNLEGKLLTGRKIIIEGQICQQIEYTANVSSQSVHSVEFFVPFSSYVVVPKTLILTGPSGPVEYDALDVVFDVNTCLEDIKACLLNERRILKQVTLLISAVPIGVN